MEYEVWYSHSENSFELVSKEATAQAEKIRAKDAVLLAKFQAESWEDALAEKERCIARAARV
jgi:hypothetical protein